MFQTRHGAVAQFAAACQPPRQTRCHHSRTATPACTKRLQNGVVWDGGVSANVDALSRRSRCTAAAQPAVSSPSSGVKSKLLDLATVASLFLVWYGSNIYFNIFNKQVLLVFPHPLICTWVHLVVSSFLAIGMWVLRVKKAPAVTPRIIDIIFPLSLLHLVGFYTTNASLGAVAVSLTHTIKSMEPFFTVAISWVLMGAKPAKRVLFSLMPVVAGVVVASATDISFNWAGFNAAMLSNVAFQTRNVLSKKAMFRASYDSLEGGNDLARLDEVNIFSLMSIGACVLMTPLLLTELPSALAHSGGIHAWMPEAVWKKTLAAGVCRFGDVLASFLILQKVTPVTHSVGNCVKRVVVIAASIVFFQTAANGANIAGTALALSGVLLYSIAKRSKPAEPVDVDKAVENSWLEDLFTRVSPGTMYGKVTGAGKPKETPKDTEELEYYL